MITELISTLILIKYWLYIGNILNTKYHHYRNIRFRLEIFEINYYHCKNISFALEIVAIVRQYCSTIGFAFQILAIKCQKLSTPCWTIFHANIANFGQYIFNTDNIDPISFWYEVFLSFFG